VAYIGNQPTVGQFRKLDDISGSFNGSTTAFTMQISGSNTSAGSVYQLMVSLGGVIQNPGTDFTVSGSTLTFTTAPTSGLDFFGVLMGQPLNVGTVADSGVTTAKIADGAVTTVKLGSNLTVDLGSGTVGAPSLTFDSDTGLFSGGDGQVNIATNGVERVEFGTSEVVFNDGGNDIDFRIEGDTNANLFFVDAGNDRIGLGTSSPSQKLEIADGYLRIGTDKGIKFDTSNSANDSELSIDSSGVISFKNSGGTSTVSITNAGNVGIGTTSPGVPLHVETTGTIALRLRTTSSSTSNPSLQILDPTGAKDGMLTYTSDGIAVGSYSAHPLSFIVQNSERARIDTSGRLLVGTSSARDNFYNATGEAPQAQIEGTTYNGSTLSLTLNQAGTQAPRLLFGKTRGASVGSNTAVQSGDQVGVLVFEGSDGTNLVDAARIFCEVDGTPGADDMPGRLVFSTTADGASSPTERMRIDSAGLVTFEETARLALGAFFGTVTNTKRIDDASNGTGTATLYIGNAAIQVSSDVRLKENIEDTQLDALDAISQIKVKDFTWNDPSDTSHNNRNARGKWTGLIAQELVEVLPFVVNAPRKEEDGSIDYESGDHWTLDQSQLCPVLIKAVQQQQEIIASLEARLSALEAS